MHFLHRLETEYRLRGAAGVVWLILSRVARSRRDLLFEKTTSQVGVDFAVTPSVVVIDRHCVDNPGIAPVMQEIFTGDNLQYLQGLRRDDLLFVALDEQGAVAAYAFVLFQTQYKRVLGIGRDVPLIGNCYTLPAHRGQRMYPQLLVVACSELARRGYSLAAISCEPQNRASIRGIERAGFTGVSMIRTIIVLLRVVLVRRVETYDSWISRTQTGLKAEM